jgi:hypothetical protein
MFTYTEEDDGAHHFRTEINGITEANVLGVIAFCRKSFGPEIGSGTPGTWGYHLERCFAKGVAVAGNGRSLHEFPDMLHKGLRLHVQFVHEAEAMQFKLTYPG